MKVTIQNGANHGLSRREAEAVVGLLPSSLSSIAKLNRTGIRGGSLV
jgi:hypothetical protein